ncbi:MAG: hypothetical protein K2O44_05080 [Clostridia bacterium]|nr:hypothetical protein [Clostridia bacterium]
MSAILIVAVILGAISGAVAGFFQKFTKSSFWGITALLTLLFQMAIGAAVKKTSGGFGIAVLVTTVVVLFAFNGVALILQKLLIKVVESRKRISHYKNVDVIEENEALILNAVDTGDKREYKNQLKKAKKIKDSAGVWGIVDGVIGAVNGCFNVLMGLGAAILALLLFVDLSQISLLTSIFAKSLGSGSWTGLGTKLAFDLPLICVLSMTVRIGYKSGISSVFSFVVIIGMLVGCGIGSYSIASSSMCAGAVEGLKNGMLSALTAVLGDTATVIARFIIAGIIFLLSLIFVILVGICLPKITSKFRENKIFCAVDGVLGAVVLTLVLLVIIMVFGGIAYTLNDLAFMEKFNTYAAYSNIGDCMYSHNIMNGAFQSLPLRGWFGSGSEPVNPTPEVPVNPTPEVPTEPIITPEETPVEAAIRALAA